MPEDIPDSASGRVESVRVLADDLGATSRAERVQRIKEAVRRVLVSVDLARTELSGP
jgi:hypothetical protein